MRRSTNVNQASRQPSARVESQWSRADESSLAVRSSSRFFEFTGPTLCQVLHVHAHVSVIFARVLLHDCYDKRSQGRFESRLCEADWGCFETPAASCIQQTTSDQRPPGLREVHNASVRIWRRDTVHPAPKDSLPESVLRQEDRFEEPWASAFESRDMMLVMEGRLLCMATQSG